MRKGDVIIDDINYGHMQSSKLPSGVKFAGQDFRLEILKKVEVPIGEITELDEFLFYRHLKIEFTKPGWNCPQDFWAIHQENVMEVAKELSKFGDVRVVAHSRILGFFENGELTRRFYIDSFYEDVPYEMKRNCEF